jgi:dihydrofolate synthase/folylpolyglutamate synthase
VLGPLDPEALVAIEGVARDRGAPVIRVTGNETDHLAIGLRGSHQVHNAAVAVRLLQILDARGITVSAEALAAGLANPAWPGRLDLRRMPDGRDVLLDAAHNPAGAEALASYLRSDPPPRPLVFAAMRDKDIAGMLAPLLPLVSALVVTRASNPRSADPETVAAQARLTAPGLTVTIEPDVTAALATAWRRAPRIVVAGSIFLLGDVMKHVEST